MAHEASDPVEIVELDAWRRRREAEVQARALVLFECAATLARRKHPGLERLVEQSFGAEWLEGRVEELMARRPRRRDPEPELDVPAKVV